MPVLWAVRMTTRYAVRAVRFGLYPWVVIDTTRDSIVAVFRDAEDAEDHASELNTGAALADFGAGS